jgi:hypothetical protein
MCECAGIISKQGQQKPPSDPVKSPQTARNHREYIIVPVDPNPHEDLKTYYKKLFARRARNNHKAFIRPQVNGFWADRKFWETS